jgi:hypothetical protein
MNRRFAISAVVPRFFALACAMALIAGGTGVQAMEPAPESDSAPHAIDPLNSPFKETEASFTHDGHTVYFACYGRFGSAPTAADICVSHLTGKFEDMQWSEPELVPFSLTEFNEQEPKISLDGKRLYFQSNRPGGKGGLDVWVSERGPSGEWQDPVSLPFPINTPFNDHCLYFDDPVNENSAYLASNRPGTLGGNDLWYTRKIDGEWTTPVNLGPNINSKDNDHMAMVGPDGRLWVTSNRAGTMGGEDQWVSERQPDSSCGSPPCWGPLINLGAPWNSPSDDRCGDWTFKTGMGQIERSDNAGGLGSEIYFVFSSSRPEAPASGAGNLDNYFVRFDAVLQSLGLSMP